MKKKFLSVLMAACMVCSLAACGNDSGQQSSAGNTGSEGSSSSVVENSEASGAENSGAEAGGEASGELVDGRFAETRHISVEVYDRGNDGGSDPTNNKYTEYIKKGMLEDHNVEVEFVKVPRWTEVEQINNLLAAGDAPDICLTYDYATIQIYADMGGVIDLAPLVDANVDITPNLWNWLEDANINYDRNPKTGTLWAIEGKRADIKRINTFVRRDWLEALNMEAPTTAQEFEDMLVAFKENASTLLGADADKMVPFSITTDVTWRAANIIDSYRDPAITDKEQYVNGYHVIARDGTKEAIRLVNKWYNMGLIWKDFALYDTSGTEETDMMKSGYVGAFIHNWDLPYRDGEDGIQANLQRLVGENAAYVAIDCFPDTAGKYSKSSYSTAGDRKLFFPTTNDEPLASLLYLDWISDPEHIKYLQIGDEGVTHEVFEDGAIGIIPATGDAIMNSGQNIDYTITCNGLNMFDDELTAKSAAHNYAAVAPELIITASEMAMHDALIPKAVQVGEISSESGMGSILGDKVKVMLSNCVMASEADFDKTWDDAYTDWLNSGAQAIIDERLQKWEETYGDAEMLP